jgi:anti-sigma factor RsiW
MIARVLPLDAHGHDAVQALLPWYVTGRLDADERARVQAHLAGCARCRHELAWERRLQAAHAALAPSGDVERGLAKLRLQIGDEARSPLPRALARGWRAAAPWLRWTVALQAALIVAVVLVAGPPAGERYRALGGAGSAAVGNAVVAFAPGASELQMRQALQRCTARIVSGPGASGAYVLEVPGGASVEALACLRAQAGVALAESLDARSPP